MTVSRSQVRWSRRPASPGRSSFLQGASMKTVLITGASSGIGKESALYFAENGWNVIATMRNPDGAGGIFSKGNIEVMYMDVLKLPSIKGAIKNIISTHKRIDAVVNNAGFAVRGCFEASTPADVRRQFETNVFGLMDVSRRIIPVFRKQGGGTIINISSFGGKISLPYYSIYSSSKFAVEGFSEGLYYELKQFNIRVKIVEPGIIKTDFYSRSMTDMTENNSRICGDKYKNIMNKMGKYEQNGSNPRIIAKLIYKAANDGKDKLRYSGGSLSWQYLLLRKIMPDKLFSMIVNAIIGPF